MCIEPPFWQDFGVVKVLSALVTRVSVIFERHAGIELFRLEMCDVLDLLGHVSEGGLGCGIVHLFGVLVDSKISDSNCYYKSCNRKF